jgi:predicted AlkP superfamily pyrophosphatase or phosphodiesterase
MPSYRNRFLSAILAIAFLGRNLLAPCHAAELPQTTAQDRIVVLVSLDGLAGFYIDDPHAELPNLRALAAAGARATSMLPVVPTVTWPNHVSLVTGVSPAKHGVVGNQYFDRAKKEQITLLSDPKFNMDEIVKVPTIFDIAKQSGMRTAAVRWPATRAAKTLDWTIPDVARNELLRKYTTPSLLSECEAAGIWEDGKPDNSDSKVELITDAMCTKVASLIIEKHRPQLLLVHLIHVDHMQHLEGPRSPDAYEAVKNIDAQVGEIWQTLQKEFPGRATIVLVSDHGFSPIRDMILPNVILKQAGLVTVDEKGKAEGKIHCVIQGGSALVYLLDENERDALATKVTELFSHEEGVASVAQRSELGAIGVADPATDPHGPDMILFAQEGYTFGNGVKEENYHLPNPERKGNHGHDPRLPILKATFIASGAGIKPGVSLGEISNLDVAPTLAKLLGINLPGTDGKVLADALGD